MKSIETDVLVLGAGPGGYAAAFYAADMGLKVTLVDKSASLGGVCLNRGCIPSKALIHATQIMREAMESSHRGISFNKPSIDIKKMVSWKDGIIGNLSKGISGLAKARNVDVIQGRGYFQDPNTCRVEQENGQQFVTFKHAIIAVGSRPAMPAAFDLGNQRIMTSTEALQLEDIPKDFLVVGGGYIGLELGTVYASLGSKVTVVEATSSLLMGADPDLVRPVQKVAKSMFEDIRLDTKVQKMATKGKKIDVSLVHKDKTTTEEYDKVLVSIGRTPNTQNLGLEDIGVNVNDRGFIEVTNQLKTSIDHIYAIGDVAGGLLLAHKASTEAKVAVESILGQGTLFGHQTIPAVVFTDPELAWTGLTETEAKQQNISVNIAKFPWSANGRSLTLDSQGGLTKLVLEPNTDRVLGVGIVGPHAGDLISEGTLAIEMGATAADLAHVIHPHPTLSETVMEAAESFYGHCAHTMPTAKKK